MLRDSFSYKGNNVIINFLLGLNLFYYFTLAIKAILLEKVAE